MKWGRRMTAGVVFTLMFFIGCAPFPDLSEDILNPARSDQEEESALPTTNPTESSSGSSAGSQNVDSAEDIGNSEPAEPEVVLVDPQGLVLNEILYDVPGSDTDGVLFVELFAAKAGSLSGYAIHFVNGGDGKITDTIDLPEAAEIADESFYVIADGRTGALETTQVETYDLIDNFDPQNGPDGVQLLDREGLLVDTVVYGEGAIDVSDDGIAVGEGSFAEDTSDGFSLSRSPAGFDTDDNATDFIVNDLPSPGSGDVETALE